MANIIKFVFGQKLIVSDQTGNWPTVSVNGLENVDFFWTDLIGKCGSEIWWYKSGPGRRALRTKLKQNQFEWSTCSFFYSFDHWFTPKWSVRVWCGREYRWLFFSNLLWIHFEFISQCVLSPDSLTQCNCSINRIIIIFLQA